METLNKNPLFSSKSDKNSTNRNQKQMYKQKRKSQVFIAAQSLNDELLNLKSLKRMSIGSVDDLDTRDIIYGQFTTTNTNNNNNSNSNKLKTNKYELETIEQENEVPKDDQSVLRQNKRLTIDTNQYPDFYDNYNDENVSSDDDNDLSSGEDSETQDNLTTMNSIENSYNVTSAEYLDHSNENSNTVLNAIIDKNIHPLDESEDDDDEDKEFTSSLLWVPANKHPSIKPEKYLKYVQGKLETLSTNDDENDNDTNGNKNLKQIGRSRSSNIEEAVLKRKKSLQENDAVALSYASRSKSLSRRPSRLRRSYISDTDDVDRDEEEQEAVKTTANRTPNKNRFSLKEITEELSKMSQNAGFSGNDAVSLARSLSMSIHNQKTNYEDDLDFENDNYYDSEFHNISHESDELSSPTSPTSPNTYILKGSDMDMFDRETEKLKRKKGKYQPSYELEIQPESLDVDDDDNNNYKNGNEESGDYGDDDSDDYVIGLDNGTSQDVGRKVTRGKTIKQVLQQQQREIEAHVNKDRKISSDSKNSISSVDDDQEEYASSFDKEEMKTPKKSTLQRSKFNTYREKSFKNKMQHLNTLKNSKSVDGLTVNTQNLIHISSTPSPTSDSPVLDQRKSSHETVSSSDTGSMHTADDSTNFISSDIKKTRKLSSSNGSVVSSHSSESIKLRMRSSREVLASNIKDSSETSPIDSGSKDDKLHEGKKKNKFYNMLKKSKFKFNKNKDSDEENNSKKLTINTNIIGAKTINTNNDTNLGSLDLSPESNATTTSSPSSPIKLPSFSSKRTLSGSNAKPHASSSPPISSKIQYGMNQDYTPYSPDSDSDDPLAELNQQLTMTDNNKNLNIMTHVDDYNVKTIDEEGVLSPLSPSDMNMFPEDFDMSDNDVEEEEPVLLISNEEIDMDDYDAEEEDDDEYNSTSFVSSLLTSSKIPPVSKTELKPYLFTEDQDGNYSTGKRLFNVTTTTVPVQSTPPITPPATPEKIDYYEDEDEMFEEMEDNGDNLPPRKLTFKDVHRPLVPNSPMKYRDSSFGFPLPPLTMSTIIMFDHRLPVSMERAIYRLSHMKLSENKRELRQQVLLSNFMYSYLNLVNHSLYLQKLEEEGSL